MSCKYEEPVLDCSSDNVVWKEGAVVNNPPANPWNKDKCQEMVKEQSTLSFRDLMSEDLANSLQLRENNSIHRRTQPEIPCSSILNVENSAETSSDYLLACYLQQHYNEEHDSQIQREENHFNKNSKLSVSFSKYKVCPDYLHEESSDEELQQHLDDEKRAIDRFEESKRTDPVIPACGYTRHNNKIVTKHDNTLSGRRNAERVMNFPPSFNTGDPGGFDMQLSNKVYNKLQKTAKNDEKRKERVQDKIDKATSEKALDVKTRLIVYKLVRNSVLESVNKIISMGKESVVFHADGGIYEEQELPAECALKIFKTTLTDFKTRDKYVRSDYRFRDRMSKNNNKLTIRLWAEKEFHNLRRLEKAEIPSPKPLLVKQYLLVMSFIGKDHIAAPKLKCTNLRLDQWCDAYDQVVSIMTTMYRKCNLVHGDMSEYNILWHEDKCWVIDLGQAVEPTHPNALKFFYRDCTNIVRFFRSKGLTKISSPLEIFKMISGISLSGQEEDAERLIEAYERNNELCSGGKREESDKFEFLWNESNTVRQLEGNSDDVKEDNSSDDQETYCDKTDIAKTKKKNKKKKKKNQSLTALSDGEEVVLHNRGRDSKSGNDFAEDALIQADFYSVSNSVCNVNPTRTSEE